MAYIDSTCVKDRTSISVVVPMYNEAELLERNLALLYATLETGRDRYDIDYILIDDGSTDATHAIARRFADDHRDVTVLRHDQNQGLGAALHTARRAVTGTYVLTVDADLSYEPSYCLRLIDTAVGGNADVVVASAYMKGGAVRNVPWKRAVLSREANRFLSMAANGRIATLTCVVRVYRRSVFAASKCTATGMDVNATLLLEAVRNGASIIEVPAVLDWGESRRASRGSLSSICALTWKTMRCGFRHRPSLLLAIPGLVPGLLPFVVALLYLLHLSAASIALGTLVTIIVQYTSLALFAGQTVTFIHRRRTVGRLHSQPLVATKE